MMKVSTISLTVPQWIELRPPSGRHHLHRTGRSAGEAHTARRGRVSAVSFTVSSHEHDIVVMCASDTGRHTLAVAPAIRDWLPQDGAHPTAIMRPIRSSPALCFVPVRACAGTDRTQVGDEGLYDSVGRYLSGLTRGPPAERCNICSTGRSAWRTLPGGCVVCSRVVSTAFSIACTCHCHNVRLRHTDRHTTHRHPHSHTQRHTHRGPELSTRPAPQSLVVKLGLLSSRSTVLHQNPISQSIPLKVPQMARPVRPLQQSLNLLAKLGLVVAPIS